MREKIDRVGQRYNRLVVLSAGLNTKPRRPTWSCLCDCGEVKSDVLGTSLVSGRTQSCGCLNSERRKMTKDTISVPLPITAPGEKWAQREYVSCMSIGVGFHATEYGPDKHAYHYAFFGDKKCRTAIVNPSGVVRYIEHKHMRVPDWIAKSIFSTGIPK